MTFSTLQQTARMKFTFPPDARPVDGYTIRRGIHRGGFGEVYYAVSDAGKEVALKLLTHDLDTELRGIRQCLNLKHPNLVTLYDVRTDATGETWVIMEYVQGANLEDVLRAFPNGLPVDEVRSWMTGLLAGTQFLHERGLVHRDLKPANVYRENGVVKIGDVGLSKLIGGGGTRKQHTESVGTVYYMAPEVAHGQYGPQIDVYSLGVMLYEMLTGRLPFDGETTAEILMKHLTARPDLTPVPVAYRAIVGRALEKNPQARFANVADFQQALRTMSVGTPLPESAFVPTSTKASVATPTRPTPASRPATTPIPNRSSKKARRGRSGWWPVILVGALLLFPWGSLKFDAVRLTPFWLLCLFAVGAFVATRGLQLREGLASLSTLRWRAGTAEQCSAAILWGGLAASLLTGGWLFAAENFDFPGMGHWTGSRQTLFVVVPVLSTSLLLGLHQIMWGFGRVLTHPSWIVLVVAGCAGLLAAGLTDFLMIDFGSFPADANWSWYRSLPGNLGIRNFSLPSGTSAPGLWRMFQWYYITTWTLQPWRKLLDPHRDQQIRWWSPAWASLLAWIVSATFSMHGTEAIALMIWSASTTLAAQWAAPWQKPPASTV